MSRRGRAGAPILFSDPLRPPPGRSPGSLRPAWGAAFLAALLLVPGSQRRAVADILPCPNYQVGDRAEADWICPMPLAVFDPDQTEENRRREKTRVPLILRYCPDADVSAEASFRKAFSRMRSTFCNAMETNLQRRVLLPDAVQGKPFRRFLANFTKRHKNFPALDSLAELWAQGQSDAAIQTDWAARLRAGMEVYIRPDALPEDMRWIGPRIHLLTLPRHSPAPDLQTLLSSPTVLRPTNLVTLSQARRNFRNGFSEEEKVLGQFLSGFLQENVFLEEALSRQARLNRASAVWVAHHYPVGQLLVRQGQIIDPQVWRALQELRARLEPEAPVAAPSESLSGAALTWAWLVGTPDRSGMWPWVGLGLAGLGAILFVLARRWLRPRVILLPAPLPREEELLLTCPSCAQPIMLPQAGLTELRSWKQRALEAEGRAQTAVAMLRSHLMPGFMQWLKGLMVRTLTRQREELKDSQRRAEQEIRGLTSRLSAMHAPLEERLKAYQVRIAELERELAIKGEENRELIRARLEAVRKQLTLEQGKSEPRWN